MLRWPQGLDAERFLADFWQREPLLLRAALTFTAPPVEEPALIAAALDAAVESRLITHSDGENWRLREGPLSQEDVDALPARDWTLLVQDVDKRVAAVAALLDRFDFVPAWRRDDIMISLAAPGGSVGPHVDNYDVFLIQVTGTRRWRYGRQRAQHTEVEQAGLSLLSEIPGEFDVVLAPGDILYLPPRVAHYGVAEDRCTTYSVGFRAPTAAELFAAVGEVLQERGELATRYADPDLRLAEARAGEIDAAAVARAARMLPSGVAVDPELLAIALGRLVTEPKAWLENPPAEAPAWPQVAARLASGASVRRSPSGLLSFMVRAEHVWAFADGDAHPVTLDTVPLLRFLTGRRSYRADELLAHCSTTGARELLLTLLANGQLYWQ